MTTGLRWLVSVVPFLRERFDWRRVRLAGVPAVLESRLCAPSQMIMLKAGDDCVVCICALDGNRHLIVAGSETIQLCELSARIDRILAELPLDTTATVEWIDSERGIAIQLNASRELACELAVAILVDLGRLSTSDTVSYLVSRCDDELEPSEHLTRT